MQGLYHASPVISSRHGCKILITVFIELQEALLAHTKGGRKPSLPTIARALIWSRDLPHRLNETARQENGPLFEGAVGCYQTLEGFYSIGNLKRAIRR